MTYPGVPLDPPTGPSQTTTNATNPDGSFNPNAAAGGAAAPQTGTDLYGLTPDEEQWTFYLGTTPRTAAQQAAANSAAARLRRANPNDKVGKPPASSNTNATALELMRQYAKMAVSPDPTVRQQWANMQAQMLSMGLYGTSGGAMLYRPGTWTDNDASALVKAFRGYQGVAGHDGAGQPLTFAEYLDRSSQQAAANGQGGGASGAAPKQTILDDPEALKSAAMTAAQAALGSGLSEDQLNKFVAQFQGAQASYQQSTDSTVVQPDATSDAMAFAQKSDPQGYANHQATGYMSALMNLFLPSQDARPTITPVASV
jgi:hypothetical protein